MKEILNQNQSEEAYYEQLFTHDPIYSTPYPNFDEAVRWAKICEYLSQILEINNQKDQSKIRIFDIGCGRGWLTNLASCFGSCDGIDPVTAPIELARKNYPDLTFYVGTLPALLESKDFRPYDVIICSEVIEHIEDKNSFLKDIIKCLVPKGHVIMTTPRGEEKEKYFRADLDAQPIEDWITEKDLKFLFEKHRFKPLKHDRAYLDLPGMSFLHKVAANQRVSVMLDKLGLAWVMKALHYKTSIYQIWWFQII
jgi:2-polyprenyl-3-methyl-5-hydroxy-6-metoxy-1,4-benzoquinol methylase